MGMSYVVSNLIVPDLLENFFKSFFSTTYMSSQFGLDSCQQPTIKVSLKSQKVNFTPVFFEVTTYKRVRG